jgi:hypothetical protein
MVKNSTKTTVPIPARGMCQIILYEWIQQMDLLNATLLKNESYVRKWTTPQLNTKRKGKAAQRHIIRKPLTVLLITIGKCPFVIHPGSVFVLPSFQPASMIDLHYTPQPGSTVALPACAFSLTIASFPS